MLVKLAFVMQRLKKYLKKFLSWSTKMGGDNLSILWGGHSCYEGDIELMGGSPSPPTGENPDIINLPCTFTHYLELSNFQFYFMIWIVVF